MLVPSILKNDQFFLNIEIDHMHKSMVILYT
jgi:hypothetical protein